MRLTRLLRGWGGRWECRGSVFQTLPYEHASGTSQTGIPEKKWSSRTILPPQILNIFGALRRNFNVPQFCPFTFCTAQRDRIKGKTVPPETGSVRGASDREQKRKMNWGKNQCENTTSETHTEINNIWIKHVCRQRENDDYKDNGEKEHHEKAAEWWLSATGRNNNYSMMIPALM